jgi:hypothetical protein
VFATFFGTAMQQQVPPDMLARVSSLTMFPVYGVGVIGLGGSQRGPVGGPGWLAFGATQILLH